MNKKYKINLDYFTYSTLLSDVESFRFLKKDGSSNKNLFINKLIYNYHPLFNKNIDDYESYIINILKDKKINNKDINDLLLKISRANIKKEEVKEKEYAFTFVTSSKYESVFLDIEDNYLTNYTFSEYIRSLLYSYTKLNQDERERVLFKEEIDLINKAINDNKLVIFSNGDITYEVKPIGIFSTKDHQYLYFIYYYNSKFYPLNLYKINNLRKSRNIAEELSDKNKNRLNELLDEDVEFISSSLIEAKIELTKSGVKKYNKIFINRPKSYKVEKNIYYFKASINQLFFYFARFGKDAYVLDNTALRNRLFNFYKDGLDSIKKRGWKS